MAGVWDPVVSRAAAGEINRQYGLNRYLLGPRDGLWMADAGRLSVEKIEQISQWDSDNDLYRYLRILLQLREVSATTQPSEVDADLERLLRQRTQDRRARLHLIRRQEMVRSAAGSQGLPMRASAVLAGNAAGYQHRPVLHELVRRLVAQGNQWRQAGRPDEAVLAHRAALDLLTDLLEDSPTPDVALLAAQHLPEALSALGEDRDALAGACADQVARVADFAERWQTDVADGRVNLLPRTAEGVLVPAEHDRALGSMCASVVTGFVWLVLCVMVIVALIVGAAFGTGQPSVWPGGRRVWAAVAGLAVLLTVVLCWLTWADVRFEWLLSLPTLPLSDVVPGWWLGVVWAAAIVVVVFAIGSDLCLALSGTHSRDHHGSAGADPCHPEARTAASRWALTSGVIVLLTLLVVLLFWPMERATWQPPVSIQKLRVLWLVVGVEALLIAVGWLGLVAWHGRAGLDRSGMCCRYLSFVAARALLVISLIGFACLVVNARNDRLHAQAFSEAVRDPVADRLGQENWRVAYFGGIGSILAGLDQRR